MKDVLESLKNISTGYSIFEKDQVLSHDQLNSISDYFDDQTRLTRVKLLGVGIVCGLRVTMKSSLVTLTKGVGVTTDGDLVDFSADTKFDKFKLYDESHPVYLPFYVENKMIPLYELVFEDKEDLLAVPLDQFNATTEKTLNDMVAVLFMESYVHDPDICSGTDCDNLGQDYINTIKLLLVDKASVGLLKETVATPNDAFGGLNEIVADRPIIPLSTNSFDQLAERYKGACNTIQGKLIAELPKLYSQCSAFLSDIFPSDPTSRWSEQLQRINTTFASNGSGIQYYYDFLKDIVETHNNFRNLLFGDTIWCSPDTEDFPKHLLLGNLVPGTNLDENRTGLYPSPLVSKTAEQLGHAKFLFRKLDTLIRTFAVSNSTSAAIRVTPSLFEDQPLEERAIPYYYRVNETIAIHKNWSYRLHQRGMDTYNYSYNAGLYEAQGAARNPLAAQIGRFSFFRIEGHLGQPVLTVRTAIELEIKNKNLPFTVQSILLGTDQTQLVKPSGTRYTDLHRFHYLLRQDLTSQLGEVAQFSGKFREKVDRAVADNTVIDSSDTSEGPSVRNTAFSKNNTIMGKTASASTKLNRRYSAYIQDSSWMSDVGDAIMAAGEFKSHLGKVVKTGFTTPFDALIGDSKIGWLGQLDEIIKNKDKGEDNKLLFSNFIALHPGMEHFSGVIRGGTFVLVYDASSRVVADFMLPYYCCEVHEVEPEEVPLRKPEFKRDWIVEEGIEVVQSRNAFFDGRLDILTQKINVDFGKKLDTQTEHFNLFKEFIRIGPIVRPGDTLSSTYTDERLGQLTGKAKGLEQEVKFLQQQASQPGLDNATRTKRETQVKEVQAELSKAIRDTTRHVADTGINVSIGSEGQSAMTAVSESMRALTDAGVLADTKTSLLEIGKAASSNKGLNIAIGGLFK